MVFGGTMSTILDLAARWRADAETLERCGHGATATLCRAHAVEIEEAIRDHQDQDLTLAEAAVESGYSSDHLRHQVAEGKIPNAGERGSPRVRRRDLPLKRKSTGRSAPTPEADARAFLAGRTKQETHTKG